MDKHSLLNVPSDSLWLPLNNGKTFWADWVPCRLAMVVDRGWGPKMFLDPAPKSSTRFHYIFLCAVDMWTLKFINNCTLL